MYDADTVLINPNVRVRIVSDEDVETPEDDVVKITYLKRSRYCLGTHEVSQEEMDEIATDIRSGKLIGLPVYAYVHSGATIRCSPFDCPWDSGMSGFAYVSREDAIKEWGKKILTKRCRERALSYVRGVVETFDQYLTGDVYGCVVQTRDPDIDDVEWETVDSCWGFFGLDYARKEAKDMGVHAAKALDNEIAERAHWAARDVQTIGEAK